jgi:dual specificity phosphatase 12
MRLSKKPTLALDTSVVQDNVPQEIVPGIFIGSIHAAFNQEALLEQGITHILNASRIPATFPKHFTYLSIDIRDKEDANILSCIPASNIFIEAGVDSGGVLVHCFGGRSRSAAFVVAFLMSSREWSYEQAVTTVTIARPVASINKGFERQLRAYGDTGYDVYCAQQKLLLAHTSRRAR